jgi:hypothetical protein
MKYPAKIIVGFAFKQSIISKYVKQATQYISGALKAVLNAYEGL